MAFALTAVRAYGREFDEALTKRFRQYLVLQITGTTADIDLDIGDTSGTFWTAIGTGTVATAFKKSVADIQTRANYFISVHGTGLFGKAQGAAAAAGVYTITAGTLTKIPNITFNTAEGATAYYLVLEWDLQDDQRPVQVEAST